MFYLSKFRRNFGLIPIYRQNIDEISDFSTIFPLNEFPLLISLRLSLISDISIEIWKIFIHGFDLPGF